MRFFPYLATITLGLAACHSRPADAPQAQAPAPRAAAPANPDQVAVSAAQLQAAGVQLGTFDRQNMSTEVQANGSVEVPPQNRVSISAVQGGYVQTVLVLPGQHVAAGAVLATLRAPEYLTLQQQYLQSKARVRFLSEELERQRVLDAEDVGAKRKLQQARADYATEQATLRATTAQLQLLGVSVGRLDATGQIQPTVALTTPLAGYVKAVSINPGQYVGPQDVLVEVLNRDDLHLELKVFEKDVAKVRVGQKILFKVQGANRPDDLTARVFLVGQAFDDNARTVRVHAHLEPERRDLLPGQFVAARIQTAGQRVRTLPETALVQGGDVSYIYRRVVSADSGRTVYQRVRVRTGQPQHGDVAVTLLDPLPDTTQLVRRGAYFLDAELRKGESEE